MEQLKLFDVNLTLSFVAEDYDDADQKIDELTEKLFDAGYDASGIIIEESVQEIEV